MSKQTEHKVIWKNYDATGRDLHVDVPLSQAILNYRTEGLVGESVFPVIPVMKQSNMIPGIPLGEFLRSESALRAPGTEANKVKFTITTQTYFCKNYALKYPLTIEDRENADEIWSVRQNGAFLIADLIRIQKELRVFNSINSSTNVNTIFTATSAWNASANAGDPLQDLLQVAYRIQDDTGFYPNYILFGREAMRTIRTNSAIRGILYPHGGGLVTPQMLGDLLMIPNAQTAEGYYTTAVEGVVPSGLTTFFDDAVFMCYNAPGNQIGPLPRYSATMRWTVPGVPNMAIEVHPFDTKVKAEEIEIGVYDDEKILDTKLGAIFKGVNSAQ